MRKGILAGAGLVLIGMGVATPAMADPWEVCVIGACLQNSCTPPQGTVMVTAPINLADPAVKNSIAIKSQLSLKVLERGMPTQSQNNCVGPFPTEAAAEEKSTTIYRNMRNSFSDVTMYRGNELFAAYGQGSSAASSPQDSRDDATSNSESNEGGTDAAASQAQAEAERRVQMQHDRELAELRSREQEAERQAEQRRREQGLADSEAAAQRDREARQKALAEVQAKNKGATSGDQGAGKDLRFVLSIPLANKPGDRVNPTCYSNVITRPGPAGWGQRGFLPPESAQSARATVDGFKGRFMSACRSASGRDIAGEGNFHWTWNELQSGDEQIANTRAQYPEDVTVSVD